MLRPGASYWLHGTAEQIGEVLVRESRRGCVFEVLAVQNGVGGLWMLVFVKYIPPALIKTHPRSTTDPLSVLSTAAESMSTTAESVGSGRSTPVCVFSSEFAPSFGH